MYKLKIEIGFTDKYTGEKYKKGKVVSFKEERAEELLADVRGLVSLVEKPKKEDKPEKGKEGKKEDKKEDKPEKDKEEK